MLKTVDSKWMLIDYDSGHNLVNGKAPWPEKLQLQFQPPKPYDAKYLPSHDIWQVRNLLLSENFVWRLNLNSNEIETVQTWRLLLETKSVSELLKLNIFD